MNSSNNGENISVHGLNELSPPTASLHDNPYYHERMAQKAARMEKYGDKPVVCAGPLGVIAISESLTLPVAPADCSAITESLDPVDRTVIPLVPAHVELVGAGV